MERGWGEDLSWHVWATKIYGHRGQVRPLFCTVYFPDRLNITVVVIGDPDQSGLDISRVVPVPHTR